MKVELSITKNDVLEELRRRRYFNEQSITHLALSETIDHKERVRQMTELVLKNTQLIEGIKLLELYFPQTQQPAPATPEPAGE